MLEKFTVEINVGDGVETGRLFIANQTIQAIELDKWGHPIIVLNSGRKRVLFNLRLKKLIPEGIKRIQEPSEVVMTKAEWEKAQQVIEQSRQSTDKK